MKAVVFTEFTQTQSMLLDLFESAGIDAVAINGRLGIHERAVVQTTFRDRARVLVSTDAGGEGINLQFAHVVVNYDLPWSPSRRSSRGSGASTASDRSDPCRQSTWRWSNPSMPGCSRCCRRSSP